MDEFSLESRAANIFDTRTKEYFSEVLSCYASGSYRSAVVMLWSVVVCDILFKLQNLVELYGDAKAKAILSEIGRMQEDKERSPIWETKLVELVAEQTQLLDIAERENLLHLQRQRHLAAHPVINAQLQLHQPNRETVRALIRNALDGLLTKAPILSKKIIDELVEDLEQTSSVLIDEKRLKAYLESKYFNRFNAEVEKAVFRALWKFVFRLTDPRCEKNRAINFGALRLLFSRNRIQFRQLIEADRDYYSTIATGGDAVILLIHFLSQESVLYLQLAEHAKAAIQHTAEVSATAKCLAWFTSPTLMQHADTIEELIRGKTHLQIDKETWTALLAISDSVEWTKRTIRLANAYYTVSYSYDEADGRFEDAVGPLLPSYALDDCIDLIDGIQKNGQTWERRGAYSDHRAVRNRALQLDPAFDAAHYEIFNRHLG